MRETIEGTVERITFANPETGYAVLKLAAPGHLDPITVVGELADLSPGETVRLEGFWTLHRDYGRQFKALAYQTLLPSTIEGITKYLGSGLIRGIGPVLAQRIVQHFGPNTLQIIDETPHRLLEVLGIGPKRLATIQAAWEEQRSIRQIMIFLQERGIRPSLAVKIYKTYGDDAVHILRTDPYRLARDIHGIGFKTADQIAQGLGIAPDDPKRIAAGAAYILNTLVDEGHVYAPHDLLLNHTAELLNVPPERVAEALTLLESNEQIRRETIQHGTREEDAIYLTPFHRSEQGLVERLRTLIEEPFSRLAPLRTLDWDKLLRQLTQRHHIQLSPEQQQAIRTALTHKITILTGGPGTGKTTTVRTLIEILERFGHTYALAAPTGRAAKRLSEATGREAQTIHRLLEYSPAKGFQHHEDNPLDIDILIVDEASMLDLLLAYHLLKALPPTSHLLLVGDVDQLPSVGAGNVLRDLIEANALPVVRLNLIFRQAHESWIVQNAHRINQGKMPLFPKGATDFFLFNQDNPEEAADLIVDIVQRRIPRRFGLDPLNEIQVLSPMYRGAVGVAHLNQRLQEALNPVAPNKPEYRLAGRLFRVGDKLMQIRNNYDKEVYNGDIGRLTHINITMREMTVVFDDRPVRYAFEESDELTHAFAISVHKSQGSEYPAVVVPIMTTHYVMLQRNLLYTAVTRARKLVVLVGTKRAIAIAVRNNRVHERHTALAQRLRQALHREEP